MGKNLKCLKAANVCEHMKHLRTILYCLYNILNCANKLYFQNNIVY